MSAIENCSSLVNIVCVEISCAGADVVVVEAFASSSLAVPKNFPKNDMPETPLQIRD
ncbi:MAG: hypothetical protein IJP91_07265 [Synergistaceae bacterium]|nr:hypothetical protein [Synergistaceae bacterium]